jgi:hypothetical protein
MMKQLSLDVANANKIGEKVQSLEDKIDKQAQATSEMTDMLKSLMISSSSSTQFKGGGESDNQKVGVKETECDLLDSVFCGLCLKISYACNCHSPAFETALCTECESKLPISRLIMSDLEKMVKNCSNLESRFVSQHCLQCEQAVSSEITLNQSGEERVCETCLGIGQEEDIQQCDAKDCAENNGLLFFHTTCMAPYLNFQNQGEDLYVCKQCNDEGKMPHVDESDTDVTDEDSWTAEDEFLHRVVSQHNSLAVGMTMRGGKVQEIFPGLDRFTVAVRTTDGGCQIEHLSIAEYERRNVARSSNS